MLTFFKLKGTADLLTDSVWRDEDDGSAGLYVVVVEAEEGLLLAA